MSILPIKQFSDRRIALFMILAAFLIRLLVIPLDIGDVLNPNRGHWDFGWEEGRIARSIAAGEGFSSPLFGKTGPTSWTTPVYPFLLAGVFRIFGIYTTAAAWTILVLNSLFSALTCLPIFFIAKRCFSSRAALWAGWIWVFFPYAIYFATGYVWGFALDTMMMSLVLWCTLAMERKDGLGAWMGYGLLWGAAALTNAVMLSTLPFLCGWLYFRRGARPRRLSEFVTAALFLSLTVTPWLARNYMEFGRLIPFRGTFWMIFWEGNTGDTSDLFPDWTNPAHNETEMADYRNRGEMGYVAEKKRLSFEFLRNYPGLYLRLTAKRFVYMWTGFWSLRPDFLEGEPFAFWNIGMSTILLILMLAGIRQALYAETVNTIPLLVVLVCYPAVYYIAHAGTEYRHPIDPIVVIFIGVLIAAIQEQRLAHKPIPI
jgi:4-amino-4-deoxy-L-arabinose transferase-like glycosyltransferase